MLKCDYPLIVLLHILLLHYYFTFIFTNMMMILNSSAAWMSFRFSWVSVFIPELQQHQASLHTSPLGGDKILLQRRNCLCLTLSASVLMLSIIMFINVKTKKGVLKCDQPLIVLLHIILLLLFNFYFIFTNFTFIICYTFEANKTDVKIIWMFLSFTADLCFVSFRSSHNNQIGRASCRERVCQYY